MSSKTDTYKYNYSHTYTIHRSIGIVLLPFNTKASQPIHLALRFRHRCVHVTSITVIQATGLENTRTTFFRRPCSLVQQKKITLGILLGSALIAAFWGGVMMTSLFDCLFILLSPFYASMALVVVDTHKSKPLQIETKNGRPPASLPIFVHLARFDIMTLG